MPDVWIAIAEVIDPSHGTLPRGVKGAYVRVLARSSDFASFVEKVRGALRTLDLDLVEVDEAELWREHSGRTPAKLEYLQLAKLADETGDVQLGDFHTFRD